MQASFKRIIGILLILASILGMLLSLAGGIMLWRSAAHTEALALSTTGVIGESLDTTAGLLDVMHDMLQTVEESFALVEASLGDSGLALENTADMTDTVGTLMGKDMAEVLSQTQDALSSTQQTARLIDDTLKIVSSIPFIGARYAPDVPLETTVEQVSNSLDPVPDTLDEIERGLQNASTDLSIVRKDLQEMETLVGDLKEDTGEIVVLVGTYKRNMESLKATFDRFEEKLPARLRGFNIAATAFLVWLFISQLGLLTQGIELTAQQKS